MGKRLSIILFMFLLSVLSAAQERIWDGTECRNRTAVLTEYLPEGQPKGVIVVCPGGSYHWLDKQAEGEMVASWLSREGYAAYVLHYRTAGKIEFIAKYRNWFRGNRHPDMICDLQRSIQLLRERYDCPLGVMGFSAGGHLAVCAAEFYDSPFLSRYGIRPQVSLRPDFVASLYPVVTFSDERYVHRRSRLGLLGEPRVDRPELRDSLSLEKHVREGMPPIFLLNCKDDSVVDYHNSVLLDSALSKKRIPHLYVQLDKGGHGFGAVPSRMTEGYSDSWQALFLDWLHHLSF